jgi:hypothetical protein
MASTDKIARYVSKLRAKVAKTETELRLLRLELERAVERHQLAVDSSRIEARKA